MNKHERFQASYRELAARMKARAEADGDIYLPNPEPLGPADHVFVAMEPSLGRWARTADEARAKVEAGFRNFISSMDTTILHHCIQQYLCGPTERYFITDLSKGAMLVTHAGVGRAQRYDRWYGLFVEEMTLVAAPGARIFTLGNAVAQHLERRAFPRPFTRLLHYSGLAAQARAAAIVGQEERFAEFQQSVTLEHVLATAEAVLSGVPARFRDEALAQLTKGQLSVSQQQLMFNYKLAFERSTT